MSTDSSSSPAIDSDSPFVDLPFGEDIGAAPVVNQGAYRVPALSAGTPHTTSETSNKLPAAAKSKVTAKSQGGSLETTPAESSASTTDETGPSWYQRRKLSRDAVAFLSSLIIHTTLLISLMTVVVAVGNSNGTSNSLDVSTGDAEDSGDMSLNLDMPQSVESTSSFDNQQPLSAPIAAAPTSMAATNAEVGVGEIKVATGELQPNKAGLSLETFGDDSGTDIFVPAGNVFGGFTVEGRGAGKRGELARANGGGADTEAAVEAAIVWLVKHQFKDGHWSTLQDHPDCMGACRHGAGDLSPKTTAATGLALLTMLGAGYTHREGKYQDEVYRGLQYLLNRIQMDAPSREDPRKPGQIADISGYEMYEQGIATFALCEAYHMTKDKWLENGAQAAVNFIRSAQAYNGAWGYRAGVAEGDLSIVGWQMMALRSASAAGLAVPAANIKRIDRFLDLRTTDRSASYYYRKPGPGVPEMTAIGGLMRLMRGWSATDPRIQKNIVFVCFRDPNTNADDGPEMTDVYFNYYATNFLFYSRSNFWPQWNQQMKAHYLSTQAKEGHEAGSWFAYNDKLKDGGFSTFESDHGLNMKGGRLYTTAMAALTLEVYYRILPIQKDDTQIDFQL